MILNKYVIREQNEAMILKAIIDKKNISRTEISTLTSLNKASVSAITKILIDNNLVKEIGIGDASSSGGRKPIQLQFNGQSALAIAFDIGNHYITAILSYINGDKISTISYKKLDITHANVVSYIESIIKQFEADAPNSTYGIVGVSIAIHGTVREKEIIFTPYYDLSNSNLITSLEKKFSYPIIIENEANLSALGEYSFSSSFNSVISLSIHSGIGAGIVMNGKLHTGEHGRGGEIGHSILYPNGKPCPCGNFGCLEQYASNKAIFEEYAERKGLTNANSDSILSDYESGDALTERILKENAKLLAIGINNITMFFDPDIIIINSSVYRKIPDLISSLRGHLNHTLSNQIIVRNSTLAEFAPLYGGIASVAMMFLNITDLKFTNTAHH